ncbi:MAG: sortase [Ruminococcus sp.]|jgi:sortase A|nr:sortase [Ruminococcus sp.]
MRTVRISCFVLGTALLLAALFLVLHNVIEDKKSGRQAAHVLAELKNEIPEFIPETTAPVKEAEVYDLFAEFEEQEEPEVPEMETIEIEGSPYIGYITIPDIDIELPVMSSWSYPDLKISPCRYRGSIYTDDLIIAAHNYRSHFGRINELDVGDEIYFTDVTGKQHGFSVVNIENLSGTDVEDMQFGSAEEWDLTIFTCTLSGQSRVTVRAVRMED